MIKLFLAGLALVAPGVAAAQKPPSPCMSRDEVAAVAGVFVPTVIEGAATRCGPALPAAAFLRSGSQAFAERLRRESDWPLARTALARVAGGKLPQGVSDKTLRAFVDEFIAAKVVQDLALADCAVIDRLAGALSPLPAQNIGTIIAGLIKLGAKDDDKGNPFRVCADAP